jgi:2-amino-4-hydroxy-6-hydroxymethyldihydropteridine diphosphokinase
MFRVYLGLGSNVGDRFGFLGKAIKELEKLVSVKSYSSVYETAPWGVENQNKFLNVVLEIDTELYPLELLERQSLDVKNLRIWSRELSI